MNLAEMRDLVRAEANLQGLNEYTVLIDSIINQELQELTQKSNYDVLRETVVFTASVDGENSFDLPDDFQRISTLDYLPTGNTPPCGYSLSRGTKDNYLTNTQGYPKYFVTLQRKLQIYPYTSFFINDTLSLAYYKKPVLVLDTDEFPVDSLIKSVQQLTMGRLLRMIDTKRAQMATADGGKAWLSSRSDAGN